MTRSRSHDELLSALKGFEIIDCHEHLAPEAERVNRPVDALHLFSHYTRLDLLTAGMPDSTYERLHDPDYPLHYRWGLFKPYLEQIRHGSYARAAFIAARELYGFEDISDETYVELSEAMQEKNKPGLYERIFRETCNIRYALTQCGHTELDSDLLIPLMPATAYATVSTWEEVQGRSRELGLQVNTLDDYVAAMEAGLIQWKNEGAVGIKSRCQPYPEASREEAVNAFEALRSGTVDSITALHPLNTYLMERQFEQAARHEMVVAVHAGMWGDFTQLDAKLMIQYFMRHSETTFDLYHLSFPSLHDAVIIGKNFGNVYLNLCWTHIMSPTLARQGMRELLDFVPVNKVFAFGGDYHAPAVDKVVGHLRMAQENVAAVLAERVTDGLMTIDEALVVARKWFLDNPRRVYGLEP